MDGAYLKKLAAVAAEKAYTVNQAFRVFLQQPEGSFWDELPPDIKEAWFAIGYTIISKAIHGEFTPQGLANCDDPEDVLQKLLITGAVIESLAEQLQDGPGDGE